MESVKVIDWILRMVKGVFIGTGFILPGVSGGALAAIFGLYERMIAFMAHLTRNFKENVIFFIPVGVGMLLGIVLLSYPLGFFLENYEAPTMWCFIGCIIGTFPSLWQQAGKEGRASKHIVIMAVSFVAGLAFLHFGAGLFDGQVQQSYGTWILAGAIIALGVLIPGLSPSNFLLYMGMYTPMTNAFKSLDFGVLIPIALGGASCMLILAKAIDMLFSKAYAYIFHIILGVVVASTIIIIPFDYDYLSIGSLLCLAVCAAGILLGKWMSSMETMYKPQ